MIEYEPGAKRDQDKTFLPHTDPLPDLDGYEAVMMKRQCVNSGHCYLIIWVINFVGRRKFFERCFRQDLDDSMIQDEILMMQKAGCHFDPHWVSDGMEDMKWPQRIFDDETDKQRARS